MDFDVNKEAEKVVADVDKGWNWAKAAVPAVVLVGVALVVLAAVFFF